jgi:hypothetical protein
MDHPLLDLINKRIAEAEKDGAFDNLAGAGKPLPPVADPENEMMNRIIRENGGVPEVVSLKREIADIRAALVGTSDRTERRDQIAKIAMLETRLGIALDAHRRHG